MPQWGHAVEHWVGLGADTPASGPVLARAGRAGRSSAWRFRPSRRRGNRSPPSGSVAGHPAHRHFIARARGGTAPWWRRSRLRPGCAGGRCRIRPRPKKSGEGAASATPSLPSSLFPLPAQYMPPMPPPGGPAGAGFSSFFSTISASVVSRRLAIEAAFCNAVRETLVGSMTPACTRFS